jgi:hypothetical protein
MKINHIILILLFLMNALFSTAQQSFFRGNNKYVVPVIPFQAPPITSGEVTNGLLLYLNATNNASYPGSGNTWYDLSGNSNHGTLSANGSGSLPSFQSGKFSFDGIGSYVSIASSVIPNSGSFSLSTWAKIPGGGFTDIINGRDATSLIGFLLTTDGSNLRAQINNPSFNQNVFSGFQVTDNNWHLITITVDASTNTMKAYVNNNLINTYQFPSGSISGQGHLSIGWDYAWGDGRAYFNGSIATVSVYNFVLTSSNITTNYNALKSLFGY